MVYYAATVGLIPKTEIFAALKMFYVLSTAGASYMFICFGYAILFTYVSSQNTVIYQIMLLVAFNVITLIFKWIFLWLPKDKSSAPIYIFYVEFISESILNFMFPVITANILFVIFIALELMRLVFSALSLKWLGMLKQRLKGTRLAKIT
jgi:hypothetical protein